MTVAGSLQLSLSLGIYGNRPHRSNRFKNFIGRGNQQLIAATNLSSFASRQDPRSYQLLTSASRPVCSLPYKYNPLRCHSFLFLGQNFTAPSVKTATLALTRSCNALQGTPLVSKLVPAAGLIVFTLWGLRPLMQFSRNIFLHKSETSWKKSTANYVMTSYLQPILLWTSAFLICRALEPIALPTEASQLVKQRLLNFVKSLSTVLAFAFCLSSVVQQSQKYFMETNEITDARNMGFQFAGKAIYTAVWVAAVSLFMELLGFSTQKWLTAGGLGTVLLTLAGREIFTNFLSSAMIHATRPFVLNEWIQTKIEGYEVSGTVEHVGWWSPTIIRGEDREAVHIPNHKFTVNVVRNLSQKTHWRIKTHLAVSHLDASKINSIVADMRKVLAKNPQVEQQKLHRRVFLENVNPENQALMILISCFVKTSHHEEYLRVKEVIILDLLRVIRHHRARLATPIRTIHKFYNEPDLESMSFSDSFFTRGGPAAKRPVLLIEPPYKVNGEDKSKSHARTVPTGEVVETQGIAKPIVDPKVDSKVMGSPIPELNTKEASKTGNKAEDGVTETSKTGNKAEDKVAETSSSDSLQQNESSVASKLDLKSNDKAIPKSTSKPTSNIENNTTDTTNADLKTTGPPATANAPRNSESTQVKPNVETRGGSVSGHKSTNSEPSNSSSPVLEDNIVLGVALDSSKRTLPIEEKLDSSSNQEEAKELAGRRTGNSTGEKDGKEI